ncbi:nucleotidyl transferase AbiEii/AbiGii toxin family protein [Planctomycetota bacterium]
MKKPLKNISASIHQRLLNKARETKRPFQELLQYYAMERFLYRLSKSEHARKFILKGAFMLRAWDFPATRPTKDLDFSGKFTNNPDTAISMVTDIISDETEPDGIDFNTDSVSADQIIADADYVGLRIMIRGLMGTARISLQLDIGFGGIAFPSPKLKKLPSILDLPSPKILCYTLESTIAEKFLAMVKRDILNSRMKDFYDIWMLSSSNDFKGNILGTAIEKIFTANRTKIDPKSTVFTRAFRDNQDKAVQWNAFIRKSRIDNAPASFEKAAAAVAAFLQPLIIAIEKSAYSKLTWKYPGPWKNQ